MTWEAAFARRMSRRRAIPAIASAGAAVTAALAACAPTSPDVSAKDQGRPKPEPKPAPLATTPALEPKPSPAETPTAVITIVALTSVIPAQEHSKLSDQELINAEAQRLGIQPNPEEQSLWRNAKQNIRLRELPFSRSAFLAGNNVINIVLTEARKSKNKRLQEPAEAFESVRGQKADIGIHPEMDQVAVSRLQLDLNPNRDIYWRVGVSPHAVLSDNTTPLQLMLGMLYGINAAVESIHFDETLAFMPRAQRHTAHMQRLENDEAFQRLTAQLQAQTMQAYIAQWGLMGQERVVIPEYTRHAARFIEYGSRATDPRWIRYVITKMSPQSTLPAYQKEKSYNYL